MARTLMIIPANVGIDITTIAQKIFQIVQEEEIPAGFFLPVKPKATAEDRAISTHRVIDLLSKGELHTLLNDIAARHQLYADNANIVVVEGMQLSAEQPYFAQLNIAIAKALDARIIIAAQVEKNSPEFLQEKISIMSQPYGDRVLGYVVVNYDREQDIIPCKIDLLGCAKTPNDIPQVVDREWIKTLMNYRYQHRLPPPVFCHNLIEAARAAKKRIVLPEGHDLRTIIAAVISTERQLAHCVLLGKKKEIQQIAKKHHLHLSKDIEIIEPTAKLAEKYVDALVELRQHKGVTKEIATTLLHDPVVLGTMMLQQGDVDGLVSGAVHTTAETVRPALQLVKTLPDTRLVSSIFFMCLPDQVLVFGDCAINPSPNAEELADIAIQSATTAAKFGIEPRVAMISYSTGNSAFGPDVDKVRAATQIIRTKRPEICVDGPLQYDAAIDIGVGKRKAPDSEVAGRANVFIFPDLDTGNAVSKAVQRTADIMSIGPMLQGLRKPVNDLSRGASAEDIVFTITLTAVQAI